MAVTYKLKSGTAAQVAAAAAANALVPFTAHVVTDQGRIGIALSNNTYSWMAKLSELGVAPGSVGSTELADGSVTNVKLASVPTMTFKGRILAGTGVATDLTTSQVKTALSLDQVSNTSDLNKPVSTSTQTALNSKQGTLVSGTTIKTIKGQSLLGSGSVSLQASRPITFGGSGVPTTGTDKCPWVRVLVASSSSQLVLTSKTAPTGGSLVVVVKKSTDGGTSFPTTVATATLTAGSKIVQTTPASVPFAVGDLITVDITSVNSASDWALTLNLIET